MLTDDKFWQRVKALPGGEPIYSLKRGNPNEIVEVDEKKVRMRGRKTPVYFEGKWGLYENYHILHRDGYLLIHASPSHGNASGSYIAMAIVLAAVPDEAMPAYEGIKLRN